MKRKLSIISIAMALMLTVLGCSSGGANTPQTSTPAPAAKKEEPAAASPSGAKTEIVYLTISDWDKGGLNQVIEAFEKQNPDIKVKLEMYPFRQLFETIEVKMGSKSKDFDVLAVDVPLVTNYTLKGYLEPLDSYIPLKDQQSKWIESAIKAGSFDGKLMAAPMNTSSQVLYYNKDILKERGITPPPFETDKRWTWEQLVDAAKKATYDKNGDGQTDVFGFSFDQISRPYQILALPESLGAKVISDNGIQATGFTNSDPMVQAGKFYFDLFNTWKIHPKITADESREYFKTGKVAFFIGGSWGLANFKDVNFGTAPHPYFEGKKIATPTGSWHVGLSKFSTKKEAAAKFIQFLTEGEGSKIWFDNHRDLPANLDVLKLIETDAKYNNFPDNTLRLSAYEAQKTAVPRPSSPGYLEWESLVNKAFEDIKNGSDPKKALDDASSQIDRQLKKYESVVKK